MNSAKEERVNPLTDGDILHLVRCFKIKPFRGVFMRNELPSRPGRREYGILNLESSQEGFGSHWVAWYMDRHKTYYFDSIGNFKPPPEFISYAREPIYYNSDQFQRSVNDWPSCGHLCIIFLLYLSTGHSYSEFLRRHGSFWSNESLL